MLAWPRRFTSSLAAPPRPTSSPKRRWCGCTSGGTGSARWPLHRATSSEPRSTCTEAGSGGSPPERGRSSTSPPPPTRRPWWRVGISSPVRWPDSRSASVEPWCSWNGWGWTRRRPPWPWGSRRGRFGPGCPGPRWPSDGCWRMRMPELHDLLERQASRYKPSPDLFERVLDRRRRRDRNRRVLTGAVAVVVAAAGIGGLLRAFYSDPEPRPAAQLSRFVGTWVSTDLDGSTQTMVVRAAGEGALEIEVRDDSARVCSGAPSTITGTGRVDGATVLVIPSPVLTCDDGSEPTVESGPPLGELLRNLTFVHDREADTLTDNFDVVWGRGKAPQLVPETEVARGVYEDTPWHLSILKNSVYLRGYLGDEIFAGY